MKKETYSEQWYRNKLENKENRKRFWSERGKDFKELTKGLGFIALAGLAACAVAGVIGGFMYVITWDKLEARHKRTVNQIQCLHDEVYDLQWKLTSKQSSTWTPAQDQHVVTTHYTIWYTMTNAHYFTNSFTNLNIIMSNHRDDE